MTERRQGVGMGREEEWVGFAGIQGEPRTRFRNACQDVPLGLGGPLAAAASDRIVRLGHMVGGPLTKTHMYETIG